MEIDRLREYTETTLVATLNLQDRLDSIRGFFAGSVACLTDGVGAEDDESVDAAEFGAEWSDEGITAQLLTYGLGAIFGIWDVRMIEEKDLCPRLPHFLRGYHFSRRLLWLSPDGCRPRLAASSAKPGCAPGPTPSPCRRPAPWRSPPSPIPSTPSALTGTASWWTIPTTPTTSSAACGTCWSCCGASGPARSSRRRASILGVGELRDYFRKPAAGGFWLDHVRRYSKSRRKAPIYWLLQSSKKSYGLWLYYHRLDKDLLFKALVNYVEPKIRLEEGKLEGLRGQRAAAGTSGREAKQLERQLDRQEAFLAELHDFRDKLRRAADLGLEPDLNDGVILNIAPLWELVPWKEAKATWEELLAGKYEWSAVGKQLREKGLVK